MVVCPAHYLGFCFHIIYYFCFRAIAQHTQTGDVMQAVAAKAKKTDWMEVSRVFVTVTEVIIVGQPRESPPNYRTYSTLPLSGDCTDERTASCVVQDDILLGLYDHDDDDNTAEVRSRRWRVYSR